MVWGSRSTFTNEHVSNAVVYSGRIRAARAVGGTIAVAYASQPTVYTSVTKVPLRCTRPTFALNMTESSRCVVIVGHSGNSRVIEFNDWRDEIPVYQILGSQ